MGRYECVWQWGRLPIGWPHNSIRWEKKIMPMPTTVVAALDVASTLYAYFPALFGLLDLADINAFASAFSEMDLNPDGLFGLSDINSLEESFTGGCV